MIPVPTGVRVWLATGHTDMRKGFASLSLHVQEVLRRDPLCGHLFCFRGRRGNLFEGDLARWPRCMPVHEAFGTGTLFVAIAGGWRGDDFVRATRLPTVGHRLETPTGDVAADIGGVMLLTCRW
jgi:transposase